MITTCPKCGKQCKGDSIGSHSKKCGVTQEQMFWAKVRKSPGCWLWAGRRDKLGYGRFDRKGPLTYAHRVSWFYTHGQHAPEGMEVAHRCDVRACCNPEHLFLASHDENMKDCMKKMRHLHGERSHHAILTEEQVLEIRRRYVFVHRRKTNARELAAEFGVKPGTIGAIAARRSWKYI